MKLTIEVEATDGNYTATLTRGQRTWTRELGVDGVRTLYRLSDHIEAAAVTRAAPGTREATIRALCARDGFVSVRSFAAELGLKRAHANGTLQSALQRGFLARRLDDMGEPVPGHFVLATEAP